MNARHQAKAATDRHTEDMARQPQSARSARRLVDAVLDSWDLAEFSDDADLIITELVANAVRHTNGSPIRVSVDRIAERRIRLGVADQSRAMPHLEAPRLDDRRGRGLCLIDALSDRWGTDRYVWGKRVWVECALKSTDCIPGRAGKDLEEILGSSDLPGAER